MVGVPYEILSLKTTPSVPGRRQDGKAAIVTVSSRGTPNAWIDHSGGSLRGPTGFRADRLLDSPVPGAADYLTFDVTGLNTMPILVPGGGISSQLAFKTGMGSISGS